MKTIILVVMFSISGCAGCVGEPKSTDPTERGLSYVAGAVLASAIIRALFNK